MNTESSITFTALNQFDHLNDYYSTKLAELAFLKFQGTNDTNLNNSFRKSLLQSEAAQEFKEELLSIDKFEQILSYLAQTIANILQAKSDYDEETFNKYQDRVAIKENLKGIIQGMQNSCGGDVREVKKDERNMLEDFSWQVVKIKDSENRAEEQVFVKVVLAYSNGNGVVKDRLFMMTVNKFYVFYNKVKELKEYLK